MCNFPVGMRCIDRSTRSSRHLAGRPEGVSPSVVRAGPPHDSRRDGGATKSGTGEGARATQQT